MDIKNLEERVLSTIFDEFEVDYIGQIIIEKPYEDMYNTYLLNGGPKYNAKSITIQSKNDDDYIVKLIKELRRSDYINPFRFQTYLGKRIELGLNNEKWIEN